jgi:acyl-CoA reductase-like NAD-dependent aldehyde dehydrogenase
MAAAADSVKRVTLELGGNDAAIVLDDVNPQAVARKVYQGAMANAGQICVAIKRAYVPSSMYDEFCDELAKLANEAVVDDGSKQGATIGPVQNRMQFEKSCRCWTAPVPRAPCLPAARRWTGRAISSSHDRPRSRRRCRAGARGTVRPGAAGAQYDDIEDVIARANDSDYGLGGTVWGRDVARATEVAKRIDTGTVWVNQHLAIDANIPFRGSKQSGIGGELGEAGLLEYTQAHIINAVPLED